MLLVPHIQVLQVLEILQHCLCNSLELVKADREMFEVPVPGQPTISPGCETILAEVQPLQPSQGRQEVGVQRGLVLVLTSVTDQVSHQGAGQVEGPQVRQEHCYGSFLSGGTEENTNENGQWGVYWASVSYIWEPKW